MHGPYRQIGTANIYRYIQNAPGELLGQSNALHYCKMSPLARLPQMVCYHSQSFFILAVYSHFSRHASRPPFDRHLLLRFDRAADMHVFVLLWAVVRYLDFGECCTILRMLCHPLHAH